MTDHESNPSQPVPPETDVTGFRVTAEGSGRQIVPLPAADQSGSDEGHVPPGGSVGYSGQSYQGQYGSQYYDHTAYQGQYGGQPYGGPYGGPAYGGPGLSPEQQPGYQPAPPRRTGAGKILAMTAAAVVLVACSAVAGGLIGAWATQQWQGDPAPGETRVIDGPQLDRASLASIANQVQPSVVSIRAGQGQGSGVVLDDQGHIITNAHVVENAEGSVLVRFSTGDVARARVIGADPRSDIAVVQAEAGSDLTPASFGDSGEVLVGDTVLAIGSPLGFEGSVTQGIISALERTLARQASGATSLSGLLQTDAAINRGNSGGPLVNLAGEVVGINTAIAVQDPDAGFLGVGFAVPSNRAVDVAEQLIAGEVVRHAFLGVSVIPAEGGGALIGQVVPGSPAAEAGLREGDIVIRMDDRAISDANDLVAAVQSSEVGQQVEIEIQRDGATRTTTVTLGEHEE
jgi:putative serine protease PepD